MSWSESAPKRSVSIITYHYHHNYGAMLQAYALSHTIANLGHNCRIIDFRPEPDMSRRFRFSINPKRWASETLHLIYSSRHAICRERFNDFIDNILPIDGHIYQSPSEMRSNPPIFDTYVTGSDQVWHPSLLNRPYGLPFLLDFVPAGSRRIAYAASFGVDKIPVEAREVMARHISQFDAISTRESSGIPLIENLVHRTSKHVLDPTLLLGPSDYNKISKEPAIDKNYVLVYPMEIGKNDIFLRLVAKLHKQTNLPFVFVFPANYSNRWLAYCDINRMDAGPREFLGLLAGAQMVITNSFHGTALSIVYKKPFLGTPHSLTNARISSLLNLLELNHRQIDEPDLDTIKFGDFGTINYEPTSAILETQKAYSLDFLRGTL